MSSSSPSSNPSGGNCGGGNGSSGSTNPPETTPTPSTPTTTSSGDNPGGGGGTASSGGGNASLTSSTSLSEEVKMSIRNISSEITIFEIKTPLPDRSTPQTSITGSTTITTINPVRTTVSTTSISQQQQQQQRSAAPTMSTSSITSHSSRPPNSFLGMSNSLYNKQIQLQPISHSFQQSHHHHHHHRHLQQPLSNRVSITPAISQRTPPLTSKPVMGQNQRTMVLNHNPNSSVRVTPATFLKNRPLTTKFGGSGVGVGGSGMSSSGRPIVDASDRRSSDSMDIDTRLPLDPLTMLETKMVEGDREIIPEVRHEGPKIEHRFIKPTSEGYQKSPSARAPIHLQQINRRKVPSHNIELIEVKDDEENKNVIMAQRAASIKESSMTDSYSGDAGRTDPAGAVVQQQCPQTAAPPQLPTANPVGRPRSKGKVPPRRRKRKRLFSTGRIGNPAAKANPPAPGKRGVGRPPNNPNNPSVPKIVPSAPTTIYRTRTMVRANLAATAAKAEENANADKQMHPPKPKTMKDVLASIPGFGAGRPRKRHYRKLSTAEQLEQTKREGHIDLETPGSILTQVNLRTILNKHTFSLLPPLYQYKLIQLLPEVDAITGPDSSVKLSSSALNNEFFARACEEWKSKLTSGEFTPEQRQKNKMEADRERLKLDPWKVKHFEPIWGHKPANQPSSRQNKSSDMVKPAEAASSTVTSSSSEALPSTSAPTEERKQSLRSSRLSPSIPATSTDSSAPGKRETLKEANKTGDDAMQASSRSDEDSTDVEGIDKEEESEGSSGNEQEEESSSCARTIEISSIKKMTTTTPTVSPSLPSGKRSGDVAEVDRSPSGTKKMKTAESNESISSGVVKVEAIPTSEPPAVTIKPLDKPPTPLTTTPAIPPETTVTPSDFSQLQKSDLGLSLKDVTICEVKGGAPPKMFLDVTATPKAMPTNNLIKSECNPSPISVSILPVVDGAVKVESTVRVSESQVNSVMKELSYVTHSSDLVIIPCTSDAKPLSISETSKVLKQGGVVGDLTATLKREIVATTTSSQSTTDNKVPCSISLHVPLSTTTPVAVGTGATLLPIPSGGNSGIGNAQKTDLISQNNNTVPANTGQHSSEKSAHDGRPQVKDELPACLIPPEIKSILPPSLTVVQSDPNRIPVMMKIESSISSMKPSTTVTTSKSITIIPQTTCGPTISQKSIVTARPLQTSVAPAKSQNLVTTNPSTNPSTSNAPTTMQSVSTASSISKQQQQNIVSTKAPSVTTSQENKSVRVSETTPTVSKATAAPSTTVAPRSTSSQVSQPVTTTITTTMLTPDVSIKPTMPPSNVVDNTAKNSNAPNRSVGPSATLTSVTTPTTSATTKASTPQNSQASTTMTTKATATSTAPSGVAPKLAPSSTAAGTTAQPKPSVTSVSTGTSVQQKPVTSVSALGTAVQQKPVTSVSTAQQKAVTKTTPEVAKSSSDQRSVTSTVVTTTPTSAKPTVSVTQSPVKKAASEVPSSNLSEAAKPQAQTPVSSAANPNMTKKTEPIQTKPTVTVTSTTATSTSGPEPTKKPQTSVTPTSTSSTQPSSSTASKSNVSSTSSPGLSQSSKVPASPKPTPTTTTTKVTPSLTKATPSVSKAASPVTKVAPSVTTKSSEITVTKSNAVAVTTSVTTSNTASSKASSTTTVAASKPSVTPKTQAPSATNTVTNTTNPTNKVAAKPTSSSSPAPVSTAASSTVTSAVKTSTATSGVKTTTVTSAVKTTTAISGAKTPTTSTPSIKPGTASSSENKVTPSATQKEDNKAPTTTGNPKPNLDAKLGNNSPTVSSINPSPVQALKDSPKPANKPEGPTKSTAVTSASSTKPLPSTSSVTISKVSAPVTSTVSSPAASSTTPSTAITTTSTVSSPVTSKPVQKGADNVPQSSQPSSKAATTEASKPAATTSQPSSTASNKVQTPASQQGSSVTSTGPAKAPNVTPAKSETSAQPQSKSAAATTTQAASTTQATSTTPISVSSTTKPAVSQVKTTSGTNAASTNAQVTTSVSKPPAPDSVKVSKPVTISSAPPTTPTSNPKPQMVTTFQVAGSPRPPIQVTPVAAPVVSSPLSAPSSPALIRVQKAVQLPIQPQQPVHLMASSVGPLGAQAPKTLTLVSQGGKPLKTAILVSQPTAQIVNQATVSSAPSQIPSIKTQKSRPKPKQMKNPRVGNTPPGQINLERSYQICKAVIQNSPNREQLQNQLVKPPPNNKVEINKASQPSQNIQGHQLTSNIGDVIQVQRRTGTPTIIQAPLAGSSSVPIISGVSPHQKVIVAHITGPATPGATGQIITQGASGTTGNMQSPSPTPTVVPLIRPVQPGSPIIVRPAASTSHIMSQPQQNPSTTIITPQQLAMLLQQQHQSQNTQQGGAMSLPIISVNQLNRPITRPPTNNASGVPISLQQTQVSTNNSPTIPCSQAQIKIVNHGTVQNATKKLFPPSPNNVSYPGSNSPSPKPQILQIQRQQLSSTGGSPGPIMRIGSPGSPAGTPPNAIPVRAQIVTSNGETLTIHRGSLPFNGPVTISRPQQQPQIISQIKRVPQNVIAFSRCPTPTSNVQTSVQGGAKPITVVTARDTNSPQTILRGSPIRIIQNMRIAPESGVQNQNSNVISSVSNLAEFISSQIAASNIRPISPLTIDQLSSQQQQQQQHGGNQKTISVADTVLDFVLEAESNSSEGSGNGKIIAITNTSQPRTNEGSFNELISCGNEIVMDLQDVINDHGPFIVSSESEQQQQPPAVAEIVDVQTSNDLMGRNVVGTSNGNSIGNCTSWATSTSLSGSMVQQQPTKLAIVSASSLANFTSQNSFTFSSTSLPSSIVGNCNNDNSNSSSGVGQGGGGGFTSSSSNVVGTMGSSSATIRTANIEASRLVNSTGIETSQLLTTQTPGNNASPCGTSQNSGRVESSVNAPMQAFQVPSSNGACSSAAPIGSSQNDSQGGVRQQQQFIIVQAAGNNGLTNLAVPTSIVITPHGQLILNDQSGKGPPRASPSASPSPIQGGGIMMGSAQQSGTTMTFCSPQALGQQSGQPMTIQVPASIASSSGPIPVSVSNASDHNFGQGKSVLPTLEIQEGGAVRVVYSGQALPNGIQPLTVQQSGLQQQPQRQFTITPTRMQGSPYCTPNCPPHPHQHETVSSTFSGLTQNVQLNQGQGSFSFSNVNLNPVNINNAQNIVQVQVSQASTTINQQTINQVLNVGVPNSSASLSATSSNVSSGATWNNNVSSQQQQQQQQQQLINLNLNGNGPGLAARIITTTKPGQHPVISIPDTTGQDFELFSSDGASKVSNINSATSTGDSATSSSGPSSQPRHIVLDASSLGVFSSRAAPGTTQGFQGVIEEVMENGGNCVCDLRAFVSCRKCGAFCHDDCLVSDLCATCLIR